MKSRQAIGLATGAALAVGAVLAARAASGPSSTTAPASLQESSPTSIPAKIPTSDGITATPQGPQSGVTPTAAGSGSTPSPIGAQETPTGPPETVTRIPGLPTAAPTRTPQPGSPTPTPWPTPKPYEGGATMFGPFRLIPPGQLPPVRETEPARPNAVARRSQDPGVARSSSVYIPPVDGWRETGFDALVVDEVVASLFAGWEREGLRMTLYSQSFADARLPIDVGLTRATTTTPAMPGTPGPVVVEPVVLGGRYVIITGRATRSSERTGSLMQARIWLDGILLDVESDTLSRNAFVEAVTEIASAGRAP